MLPPIQHRFDRLKSHQQELTSANGVGHTTKSRDTASHRGPCVTVCYRVLLLSPHQTTCPSHAPFYCHAWTRPQNTKSHLSQLIPNPEGAVRHFPAENCGLRLGGANSHAGGLTQSAPEHVELHGLMKPTEPTITEPLSFLYSPLRNSQFVCHFSCRLGLDQWPEHRCVETWNTPFSGWGSSTKTTLNVFLCLSGYSNTTARDKDLLQRSHPCKSIKSNLVSWKEYVKCQTLRWL